MSQHNELIVTIKSEAVRAAPPVTVGGATIFGVPLPEVVLWATLMYTAMQAYFLLRDKVYKPWKEKRDEQARNRL